MFISRRFKFFTTNIKKTGLIACFFYGGEDEFLPLDKGKICEANEGIAVPCEGIELGNRESVATEDFLAVYGKKKDRRTFVYLSFLSLAEKMRFELMCRKTGNCISSAARCDHFDTSPYAYILYTIFFNFANKISLKHFLLTFFLPWFII